MNDLNTLLSDPHEEGMNFDQMMEEAANSSKRVDETQNPVKLRWNVTKALSKKGTPQFILTGKVVMAGEPIHPRTKKSIIDQEVKFYVAEEPKSWDASRIAGWIRGIQSQHGIDIVAQKNPTVRLDLSPLEGVETTGDIYYKKSDDPSRPFMQFRPTVVKQEKAN